MSYSLVVKDTLTTNFLLLYFHIIVLVCCYVYYLCVDNQNNDSDCVYDVQTVLFK